MSLQPTKKIWMDGELVDWADAKVHVLSHALHYGTAIFEGIRAYETPRGAGVFRLTDHIRRLYRSAHILMMDIPFTEEQLIAATKKTLAANELPSAYIRPLVHLGYGVMGLNPLDCPVNVSISMWPWASFLGDEGVANGITAKISSWQRPDANVLPPTAKASALYLNSGLAKVEAVKAGYEEAILLNNQGFIAEGTGENMFAVQDGVLVTPPSSSGALEGITRNSVITIARDLGFEVKEANLVRADLYCADEVFCTGTAAEVVPIRSVDDRNVGTGTPGPTTRKIQETYAAAVRGQDDRYKDWVEYAD